MHPETIVEAILRMVKEANGLKDRDLCFALRRFHNDKLTDAEIDANIEELIKANKLIAIEYSFNFTTIRNFLLPADTPFIIRGQKEKTHRI